MPDVRLPPSVYWRRRFVVLGLPLVVIVVLVLWLTNRGGHDDAASAVAPSGRPTSSASTHPAGATHPAAATHSTAPTTPAPSSTPTHSAPPGGVPDCAPPALTVALTTGAASVPAGVSPSFTVTVTNTGNTQCVVDTGALHEQVVVTSGTDRVWSSKDCAPAGSPARTLLLAPGMKDATQVAWNRVRSAAGCPAHLPAPKPGSYQATVSLAGATGGPVAFQLH